MSEQQVISIHHHLCADDPEWEEFERRFRNDAICRECKRVFVEDTRYQMWFHEDDVELGIEPAAADEVNPIETQQGWFCSEECHEKYLAVLEEWCAAQEALDSQIGDVQRPAGGAA